MRRLSYVLAFMLLLSMSAFATGVGDLCVKIDNGIPTYADQALLGFDNELEVWMANDATLKGMSPAIEMAITQTYTFDNTWGMANTPVLDQNPYVKSFGRAVGAWNLPGLQVTQGINDVMPDSVLFGGASFPGGMPSGVSEKCYSLKFFLDGGGAEDPNGVTVTAIYYPPAGTWTYDDGVGYPPTFCGNSTGGPLDGQTNPQAPPAVFPIIEVPCLPPVWTATPAATVNRNHCMDYDFMFVATEGGNIPPADPVTYSGDNIATNGAFHVDAPNLCSTDAFNVTATNACQATVGYGFSIIWGNNDPTITNCPTVVGKVGKGNPWTYNFNATDPDICDGFTWTVQCVDVAGSTCPCQPVGAYGINALGEFYFNTDDADGGCTFCFNIEVQDPCFGFDECEICVEVLETEPFVIRINKVHDVLQGHYVWVCIGKVTGSEEMGGYDFLVAYDASALTFISAKLGWYLEAEGWEYFTYRYGPWGNCTGPCPSGFVRLVAIADMNNGPYHPTGYAAGHGQLAEMKFYVTNDRAFECQFVPLRFIWQDCGDCGDNGISSVTGDTLFIMERVFDFEWNSGWVCGDPVDFADTTYELTWLDAYLGFGFMYGGPDPACTTCVEFYPPDHPTHPGECKNKPVQFVWFWNGGVDIACAESIDARGDINMNGIAHEIADAVLFTNYFLQGIVVFDIALEGQIAATDVNNDGLTLSVGDLVYLIRVVTGDALPFPKLAPFANSVEVDVANGLVSARSANDIGALFAVFETNGSCEVINHTTMELASNVLNGELRVLLYSGLDDMTNYISAGEAELFTVVGDAELVKVEFADFSGNLMTTHVNKTVLPTAYALRQNVPNPFNPTTRITLELPELANWNLNIYNVAGQLVKGFSGNDIGVVSVEWDASHFASGVYFYRATAGAFTDTKKMVLMK